MFMVLVSRVGKIRDYLILTSEKMDRIILLLGGEIEKAEAPERKAEAPERKAEAPERKAEVPVKKWKKGWGDMQKCSKCGWINRLPNEKCEKCDEPLS
jgi:hypothetical protein